MESKPTHEVVHAKLYLSVANKVQHVEKGTLIAIDNEMAERLGKKVQSLSKKKELDLSKKKEKK